MTFIDLNAASSVSKIWHCFDKKKVDIESDVLISMIGQPHSDDKQQLIAK